MPNLVTETSSIKWDFPRHIEIARLSVLCPASCRLTADLLALALPIWILVSVISYKALKPKAGRQRIVAFPIW